MATLQSLNIAVNAITQGFDQGLAKSQGKLKAFESSVAGMSKRMQAQQSQQSGGFFQGSAWNKDMKGVMELGKSAGIIMLAEAAKRMAEGLRNAMKEFALHPNWGWAEKMDSVMNVMPLGIGAGWQFGSFIADLLPGPGSMASQKEKAEQMKAVAQTVFEGNKRFRETLARSADIRRGSAAAGLEGWDQTIAQYKNNIEKYRDERRNFFEDLKELEKKILEGVADPVQKQMIKDTFLLQGKAYDAYHKAQLEMNERQVGLASKKLRDELMTPGEKNAKEFNEIQKLIDAEGYGPESNKYGQRALVNLAMKMRQEMGWGQVLQNAPALERQFSFTMPTTAITEDPAKELVEIAKKQLDEDRKSNKEMIQKLTKVVSINN